MRKALLYLLFGVAAFLSRPPATFADDRWLGTWRLDVAKSNYSPGAPPRSTTIKLEPFDGGIKYTTDGVDALGKRIHFEYVAKFDGGDYPFKGSQAVDTISIRRIDDSSYETTLKKAGAVVTTTRTVISRDGRTRTTTQTGKNAQGEDVNNTIVYKKQ